MHKVSISFDRAPNLYLTLNDEQYAAAMDESSWEDFIELMQEELMEHLFAETMIDDVRDIW